MHSVFPYLEYTARPNNWAQKENKETKSRLDSIRVPIGNGEISSPLHNNLDANSKLLNGPDLITDLGMEISTPNRAIQV